MPSESESSKPSTRERRKDSRHPAQPEYMVGFVIIGHPVYQLKLQDLSTQGLGAIVRSDSQLLSLIEVGQQVKLRLLSISEPTDFQGTYQANIVHITESKNGPFRGHLIVGIQLLQKVGK